MASPLAVSLIRLLVLAGSCLLTANALLIPESNPQTFQPGETIRANVNSLTSYETQLTYDYYSLPFCTAKDGVKRSASPNNTGTNLSGLRMYNSPYLFRLNVQETVKPVCEGGSAGPLTKQHVKDLKQGIENRYRVRLVLDNLPITLYDLTQVDGMLALQPGFELGAASGKDYVIFNHLSFNVLIHRTHGKRPSAMADAHLSDPPDRRLLRYEDDTASGRTLAWPDGVPASLMEGLRARSSGTSRGLTADGARSNTHSNTPEREEETQWEIVGFEVMPCSIKRTAGEPLESVFCKPWGHPANPEPQVVAEGEDIVYTYDVYWQESEIEWAHRWDAYTLATAPSAIMRWYSIALLLLLGVLLMCIVVAIIVLLIVRRNAAKHANLLESFQAGKERLWSCLDTIAFQAPSRFSALRLYACTGTGVQLLCAVAAALVLAAAGLLTPARRGALLTALPAIYFGLSGVGFYVSAVLARSLLQSTAEHRTSCSLQVMQLAYLLHLKVYEFASFSFLVFLPYTIIARIVTGPANYTGYTMAYNSLCALFALGLLLTAPGGALSFCGPRLAWPGTADTSTTNAQPNLQALPKTTSLSTATKRTALYLAALSLTTATGAPAVHVLMLSLWRGYYFTAYTGLLSAMVMMMLCTAACSVLCTYVQLRAGDGRWWWQAFRRGGAPALLLLAYAGIFRTVNLPYLYGLGLLQYGCYMATFALAVYVSLGAVGFASSFAFVYYVHARVGPTDVADVHVNASDASSAAPDEKKLPQKDTMSV